MSAIPSNFQGVFWSRDIQNLDLQKDKDYIIHQILAFGSLEQIKWLKSSYGKDEIRNIIEEQKPGSKTILTKNSFGNN